MPKYINEPNQQMIEAAKPVFQLRDQIIHGICGEIAHQQDLYERQRKRLADREPDDYYHSGLYFRVESVVDPDTQQDTHFLKWAFGKKILNKAAAVAAREGKISITRHIPYSGKNGNYLRKDFRGLLRWYKPWEIRLAFQFEKQRLQPLRRNLRDYNAFIQTIKRAPRMARVGRGFVDLGDD